MQKKIVLKFFIIVSIILFSKECAAALRKAPAVEMEDPVLQARKAAINLKLENPSYSRELVEEIDILCKKKQEALSETEAALCIYIESPCFLYAVVRAQNASVLQCVAKHQIELNRVGPQGTLLHVAINEGLYTSLKVLCELKLAVLNGEVYLIPVNKQKWKEETPQDLARRKRDETALEILCKRYLDSQQGEEPLDEVDQEMLAIDWSNPKARK